MSIVAVLVFLLLRLTPGDPAAIIAGDNANAEQIALDPQGSASTSRSSRSSSSGSATSLHGDFGESFFFKKPVAELIAEPASSRRSRCRSPPSSSRSLVAVPLGVLAALQAGHAGSTGS